MSPQRIQRRRTKGWRTPEGAVYVGRPTRWGNPWRVELDGVDWVVRRKDGAGTYARTEAEAHEEAVRRFRMEVVPSLLYGGGLVPALCGRDLACWCPLDQPCHADVLLEIANGRRHE